MIEAIFGLLALAASGTLMTGLADSHLPPAVIGPFRDQAAAVLALGGLLITMHGSYRMLRSSGRIGRFWLRTVGLASATLALWVATAFAGPVLVATLNAATVGGFPFGYYVTAQGALIALVILLFLYARRQEVIEIEEEAAEVEDAWRAI